MHSWTPVSYFISQFYAYYWVALWYRILMAKQLTCDRYQCCSRWNSNIKKKKELLGSHCKRPYPWCIAFISNYFLMIYCYCYVKRKSWRRCSSILCVSVLTYGTWWHRVSYVPNRTSWQPAYRSNPAESCGQICSHSSSSENTSVGHWRVEQWVLKYVLKAVSPPKNSNSKG